MNSLLAAVSQTLIRHKHILYIQKVLRDVVSMYQRLIKLRMGSCGIMRHTSICRECVTVDVDRYVFALNLIFY